MEKVILLYFVFINFLTFVIFAYDKFAAKNMQKRRISEKELHTLTFIGGFLGAPLAMALFHHKVAKSSFLLKQIIILLLWVVAIIYYLTQLNFISSIFSV